MVDTVHDIAIEYTDRLTYFQPGIRMGSQARAEGVFEVFIRSHGKHFILIGRDVEFGRPCEIFRHDIGSTDH